MDEIILFARVLLGFVRLTNDSLIMFCQNVAILMTGTQTTPPRRLPWRRSLRQWMISIHWRNKPSRAIGSRSRRAKMLAALCST